MCVYSLLEGKFWPSLTSLIVSHVSDEVPPNSSFVPLPLRNESEATPERFENFLDAFMPSDNLAPFRDRIKSQYPQADQRERAALVIRDSSFTCNTRQLFDAYYPLGKPVYMVNYHFLGNLGKATHASDLLPTFSNKDLNMTNLVANCVKTKFPKIAQVIGAYMQNKFAPAYQSYFKSHAIYGDPSTAGQGLAQKVKWTPATLDGQEYVQNVLQPYYNPLGTPFTLTKDTITGKSTCDFWTQLAADLMTIDPDSVDEDQSPLLIAQDPELAPPLEL